MENPQSTATCFAPAYPEFPRTYNVAYGFENASVLACNWHSSTNHLYDKYLPYEFHLQMVVSNCHKFCKLIPIAWYAQVESACWLHDAIEDARVTYADINRQFGVDVADMVYAVTNEKGKNRRERESEVYFAGIRNTPQATFVKLCDRIANIEYSRMTAWNDSGKLEMYRKEHSNFKAQLFDEKYIEMFDYIDSLLA